MHISIRASDKIKISKSKIPNAGRGVFALRDLAKGEKIETCPVFVLPKRDYSNVKRTALNQYYFMWGTTTCAICFGFGSLYNHSYDPNATYKKKIKEHLVEFTAIKPIKKGSEITVNYNNGDPYNKKTLWIKEIKPVQKQ